MYFSFFKLHSWDKRSAVRRRRFIQRLLDKTKIEHVIARRAQPDVAIPSGFGSLGDRHASAAYWLAMTCFDLLIAG